MKRLALLLFFLATTAFGQALTNQQTQGLREYSLLTNAGFENGAVRWTNSGATFAVTTTAANVAYGAAAGSWDATATAQTLTSETVSIPPGAYGATCKAVFPYKGGDANIVAEVLTGSTVLSSRTLVAKTLYGDVKLDFDCPSTGSMFFRLRSTADAAIIYIDQVYLGLERFNPSVSPVVYELGETPIGTVGTSGQVAAGHILGSTSFNFTFADNIAFWHLTSANEDSGATSCSSGAAACNLTNNGSAAFTGTDILGTASSILSCDGSNDYLSSLDAFTNPGDTDFTWGTWFNVSTLPASNSGIIGNWNNSASQRSFLIRLDTTGKISMFASTTGTDTPSVTSTTTIVPNTWYHVAGRFNDASNTMDLFINGVKEITLNVGGDLWTVTTPGTNNAWNICTQNNGVGSLFITGRVQEAFLARSVLSDADIYKLYSYKKTFAKNIGQQDQKWVAVLQNSTDTVTSQLDTSSWLLDSNRNEVFWDLSSYPSTSTVNVKLEDTNFTAAVLPAETYDSGYLSAAPSVPFNHGLPYRPTELRAMHEGDTAADSWQELPEGTCWLKGDTQIDCNFTGITISGSRRIQIIASMIPGGSAAPKLTRTRYGVQTGYVPTVETSYTTVTNADLTLTETDGLRLVIVSTGASDRTMTLPAASVSKGRELIFKKSDAGVGKVIVDGNSTETIDGATTTEITTQYGFVRVYCDGTGWHIVG